MVEEFEDLQTIQKAAEKILADYHLLTDMQRQERFHNQVYIKIVQLQNEFDSFSSQIRKLDPEQRKAMQAIREDVHQCYQDFCCLQEEWERKISTCADAEEELEDELPQIPEADQEEEAQIVLPDKETEKKKKRRTRPKRPNMREELWHQAVAAGIPASPDQPIRMEEVRLQRLRLEEAQRRAGEQAAEIRKKEQEQFQKYQERMERAANFQRLEHQHLDMIPDWGRSNNGREPETAPHPELLEEQQRHTDAKKAEEAQQIREERERYVLKRITRCTETVTYSIEVAARNQSDRLPYKTGNDALIGLAKGTYYLSTAAGVGQALLARNPAASLVRSAQTVTSAELAAHSHDTARRYRELQPRILQTQQAISQLAKAEQNPRIEVKKAALQRELVDLRKEKLSLGRQIPRNQQIAHFLHQQRLDGEILQALRMDKNRIPSKAKTVSLLSQQILKEKAQALEKRYGTLASASMNTLNGEIHHLVNQGKGIKAQIRALERKGAALTSEERKQLLSLHNEKCAISQQVALRVGVRTGKTDLLYFEGKLGGISHRAQKRRQQILSGVMLLRNLALQPLDENTDTQGLRIGVDFVTSRRNRRMITGAARLPLKSVQKAAQILTPAPIQEAVVDITAEVHNRIWIARENQSKKIRRIVRHGARQAERLAATAVPSGLRRRVSSGIQNYKTLSKKYSTLKAGIQNRAYQAKVHFANTPLGKLMAWQKIQKTRLAEVFRIVAARAKAATALALLGLLILLLLTAILSGIAGSMAASSTTLILSPAESHGGKINLAPYSQIIRQEMARFNGEIANIMRRYEDNEAYENVTLRHVGQSNNARELLSMMAVRMGQALNLEENPSVKDYLVTLYRASHSYGVAKHQYRCDGCKERVVQKVVLDPVTGQPIVKLEKEKYCPGHTDVTITIQTIAFDAIFDADPKPVGGGPWEGWTEETIAWCKQIYDMDWRELYEGIEIAQDIQIGGVMSTEHERKIWDFFLELTGNAYGAAGLMGNLYAESGLNPINLQDSYEGILGYDDRSYTDGVDADTYQNFSQDQAGYGLAQWTYHTRKEALLNLAKSRGVSVGNLALQLEYLGRELSGSSILADLSNATSVREGSDIVMLRFENPADQSEYARALRASYCEYYYNKMTLGVEAEGNLTQKQLDVITVAMHSADYGIPANPGYCQQWAAYVYAKAGLPIDGSCCAYHSGVKYGVSDDWNAIPPGAAVYGYSGSQYGHVGIYVGNGQVYHNIGRVAVDSLADWVRIYKGFAWGWMAGSDLTA